MTPMVNNQCFSGALGAVRQVRAMVPPLLHWAQAAQHQGGRGLLLQVIHKVTIVKVNFICRRNCKQPSGKGGKAGSGSDMDTD